MRKNDMPCLPFSENEDIFVTRSPLPPLAEYLRCVEDIFATRRLTNNQTYVHRLEESLGCFLKLPHVSLCVNGTAALQLALRLSGLAGKKVVTTPFTYVATLSALLWEGCTPVFADIDPDTLCLAPEAVEEALDVHPDVAGLLPVHVYGNACDVDRLERLCIERGLTCMYDAAHAFGSTLNGHSLLEFGNYAACSFHATKLFHTVEGGCLVTHNIEDQRRVELLRAFGHIGDEHLTLGINAKMSELHAAMGLCLLPLLAENIRLREEICTRYDALLTSTAARGRLRRPRLASGLSYNYAYYPIIFEDETQLLRVKTALEAKHIHPRRYFYPALTELSYLPPVSRVRCPQAEDLARRVLCLPLYAELTPEQVENISDIVLRQL